MYCPKAFFNYKFFVCSRNRNMQAEQNRNPSTTRSGQVYNYSARYIPNPALAIPNPVQDIPRAVPNPYGAFPKPRRRKRYRLKYKRSIRVWSEQDLAEVLCTVCHRTGVEMKRLRWPVMEHPCGHKFCIPCIQGWRKRSPDCPMCNQPVAGRLTVFRLA